LDAEEGADGVVMRVGYSLVSFRITGGCTVTVKEQPLSAALRYFEGVGRMKSPGVFPEKARPFFLTVPLPYTARVIVLHHPKQCGWEYSYLSGNTVRTLGIAGITSLFFNQ